MAKKTLQLRRDTEANWTSNDPTLAEGEMGVETDTLLMKLGDGATAWTALDYFSAVPSQSEYARMTIATSSTDDIGSSTVWTLANFDTEDFSSAGIVCDTSAGNHKMTVTKAGVYQVNAALYAGNFLTGSPFVIDIYVDGVKVSETFDWQTKNDTVKCATISDIVQLDEGSYVQVYCRGLAGDPAYVTATIEKRNFFSMHRISNVVDTPTDGVPYFAKLSMLTPTIGSSYGVVTFDTELDPWTIATTTTITPTKAGYYQVAAHMSGMQGSTTTKKASAIRIYQDAAIIAQNGAWVPTATSDKLFGPACSTIVYSDGTADFTLQAQDDIGLTEEVQLTVIKIADYIGNDTIADQPTFERTTLTDMKDTWTQIADLATYGTGMLTIRLKGAISGLIAPVADETVLQLTVNGSDDTIWDWGGQQERMGNAAGQANNVAQKYVPLTGHSSASNWELKNGYVDGEWRVRYDSSRTDPFSITGEAMIGLDTADYGHKRWRIQAGADNVSLTPATIDLKIAARGGQTLTDGSGGDAVFNGIVQVEHHRIANPIGTDATPDDYRLQWVNQEIKTAVTPPTAFTALDLPALSSEYARRIGARRAMVWLMPIGLTAQNIEFRPQDFPTSATDWLYLPAASLFGGGTTGVTVDVGHAGLVMLPTDADGIIEWKSTQASESTTLVIVAVQLIGD